MLRQLLILLMFKIQSKSNACILEIQKCFLFKCIIKRKTYFSICYFYTFYFRPHDCDRLRCCNTSYYQSDAISTISFLFEKIILLLALQIKEKNISHQQLILRLQSNLFYRKSIVLFIASQRSFRIKRKIYICQQRLILRL